MDFAYSNQFLKQPMDKTQLPTKQNKKAHTWATRSSVTISDSEYTAGCTYQSM